MGSQGPLMGRQGYPSPNPDPAQRSGLVHVLRNVRFHQELPNVFDEGLVKADHRPTETAPGGPELQEPTNSGQALSGCLVLWWPRRQLAQMTKKYQWQVAEEVSVKLLYQHIVKMTFSLYQNCNIPHIVPHKVH
jgi:hypothetical protein